MQSPIELNVEKSNLEKLILKTTGASKLNHLKDIQTLWSGYGKIVRYGLKECDYPSVVVKHVKLPDIAHHPRGWNTDRSHQRKVKSYQVESAWYECVAKYCDRTCRVPQSYAVESGETEFFMLLEDLDAAGFPVRKQQVDLAVTSDWKDMQACLSWLANFHATFMNRSNEFPELWDKGSYWHLDTRPDELEALEDIELKDAAVLIDQQLDNCRYKTLIHGDAKLANFCFATNSTNNNSNDSELVAAVDFQYVGSGCGMKDIAYFIGSCLYDEDCERFEQQLLDFYFSELRNALNARKTEMISKIDFSELEVEWREMYSLAWTDFHRFVKGWSPGHWKIHGYSERLAKEVIARIALDKRYSYL